MGSTIGACVLTVVSDIGATFCSSVGCSSYASWCSYSSRISSIIGGIGNTSTSSTEGGGISSTPSICRGIFPSSKSSYGVGDGRMGILSGPSGRGKNLGSTILSPSIVIPTGIKYVHSTWNSLLPGSFSKCYSSCTSTSIDSSTSIRFSSFMGGGVAQLTILSLVTALVALIL